MASADLQTFIEDRLRVYDPTIDLTPGSPAQVQVVQPLLNYLGTDPFETDIKSFLIDRFTQEFPDVFQGDPGVISDVLIKPLILFLEPFKRETQLIKNNQSLRDASVLSNDSADALVANFFQTRPTGGYAKGVARVYFANPSNVTCEITTRFYTSEGLNFYPTNPVSISAEEMVFNREGSLYYMDVAVQAEAVGEQYNIRSGTSGLSGVTGIFGVLKVSNPNDFSNGTSSVDTPTFVAQAQQALNERSMVTRRGSTARLNDVFQGSLKAVQVIGAGDAEMQRDILVATSPGHAWLTGQVSIYKNIALVMCRTVDAASTTTAPAPGDELYLYIDQYANGGLWASLPQGDRFVRLPVEELLVGPQTTPTPPFQAAYFVRFSDPDNVLTALNVYPSLTPVVFEGGFSKKGTVHVSSLPGTGATDLTVNNQEVHVLGHSDIYVRPTLQNESITVIESLADDPTPKYFTIQRTSLQTYGATVGEENKVTDATFNFSLADVSVGDIIAIETGNDAGTYRIGAVIPGTPGTLYLTSKLTVNSAAPGSLRYRIIKKLHVNPFAPKIPKVPFGSVPANDLQTSIGSSTFVFNGTLTDLVSFGVEVGDTIRVLDGVDVGDFTVTAITDGKHITVDRPAGGSNANLSYEVFTSLSSVSLPLVRIRELLVLDSTKQSTGVDVPYADPVAVVPTCDFTTALVRASSVTKSGIVLPQLNNGVKNFVSGGDVASLSGDRRYSLGFDPTDGGTYKSMVFSDLLAHEAEFLFPLDASSDGCSYFMAAVEDTSLPTNYPPIDPKPGDALTIHRGPNKGGYLIRDVRKFKYYDVSNNVAWVYFVKIYGKFPVDVLRQIVEFCDDNGAPIPKVDGTQTYPLAFPGFFQSIYNNLGSSLHTALLAAGVSSPGAVALQAAIDLVATTNYSWGNPARGVIRSYFNSPTLFQQNTGLNENPTIFSYKNSNGEVLKFRTTPTLYTKQQIVPARLNGDYTPLDFPRDDVPTGSTVAFSTSLRSTMFQLGVSVGDVLSLYPEFFFHGSTGSAGVSTDRQTAVQTVAGSNAVTAPATASGSIFTSSMIGSFVFIDEASDVGAYRVTDVPDGYTLLLDRPLTVSTPTILAEGASANWGYDGADNIVTASAGTPFLGMLNKYITLYGIDSRYQGSYLISGIAAGGLTAQLTRPGAVGNFPAFPVAPTTIGRWVVTDAPPTAPTINGSSLGTELYGLRSIRVYDSVPLEFAISSISTDLSVSSVVVSGTPPLGVKQPFQIYRPNIRRVTPSEMNTNTDGPLFYFDSDVVSLGCEAGYNLNKDSSYLTVDLGTYDSLGYRHIVDDNTRTYSVDETGVLEISTQILPTDNEDSLDNMLSLVGVPVQVGYEYGDIVKQVQDFILSGEDRVTAANMLARHFLPTYVSYDASYTGGSSPSVVAQDIVNYIDNITIETPVDVSLLEELIAQRGGNVVTPTKVIVNIHDWDRKQWVEFSTNEVGGTQTVVPYNGTPRISCFVSGQDASGQSPLPKGERINLTQL